MYSDEFLMSRYEELLKEAERSLLISQARLYSTEKKYSLAKVLAWWGSYLCLWGNLLRERYGDPRTSNGCHAVKKGFKV